MSEDLLVPSFLAVIGAKTYGLIKNKVVPNKPAEILLMHKSVNT